MRAVLVVLLMFGVLVAGGCGAQGSGGQGSGAQTSEQEEGPVPKSWEAAHGSSDDGGDSGGEDRIAGKVRWAQMNMEFANEQASVEEARAAKARENLKHLRENRERLRRLVPEMKEASKELGGCVDPRYSSGYVSVQDFSVTNQELIENNTQIKNTRSAAEQLRDAMRAEGNSDPALRELADKTDAAATRLARAMRDRDIAAEDLNRNGERIAQEADQIKMDAGC